MFGHLQTEDDIEAPAQAPRRSEILEPDELGGDRESGGAEIHAVNAANVFYSQVHRRSKPRAGAATYIQQAGRPALRKHHWQRRRWPCQRMMVLRMVIIDGTHDSMLSVEDGPTSRSVRETDRLRT